MRRGKSRDRSDDVTVVKLDDTGIERGRSQVIGSRDIVSSPIMLPTPPFSASPSTRLYSRRSVLCLN